MADTVTTSGLDAITKEFFPLGPKITNQRNLRTPAWDLIQNGPVGKLPVLIKFEGKYMKVPRNYKFNPNSAIGTGASSALPKPGSSDINAALFNIAEHSTAFRIQKRVMDTVSGNHQSVVDAMQYLMAEEPKTHRLKLNWLCHRDGSGEIGRCGTTSATNVVNLAAGTDLRWIEIGTEVCFKDIDDSTVYATDTVNTTPSATAYVVTAKTESATSPTVTVLTEGGATPSLTTSSAHGMYFYNSQGESMNGFGIVCSASNPANWGSATAYFGEIDRSSDTTWQGQSIDAAIGGVNQVFTIEDHIIPMRNRIDIAAPEEVELLCLVGYDSWDNIALAMTRPQRTVQAVKLQQKYDSVQYQNVFVVKDKHAPINEARFVDTSAVYRVDGDEFSWDEDTGSIWRMQNHPVATGRPIRTYRADARSLDQIIASRCNTSGRVYNLAATA